MRIRTLLLILVTGAALGSAGCMTAIASFQPTVGDVIVLATTDADGVRHERVLSPIDDGGRLYISANHWPRAWYRRALANPEVQVRRDGATSDYLAVGIDGEELAGLRERAAHPFLVRLGMGFAPRKFLRLDPR